VALIAWNFIIITLAIILNHTTYILYIYIYNYDEDNDVHSTLFGVWQIAINVLETNTKKTITRMEL